jgi:hypothetical protein
MARPPTQAPIPEKSYWKNPSNLVGLLTLAAVLTYTAFQIWQTFLIRSNNVVSERAFAFFDAPTITMVFNSKDQTKNVQLGIPIINGGNTATKDLTMLIRCAPSVESLPEPWVILHREPTPPYPQVLGPHQTVRVFCVFRLDQVRDIERGNLHGYLMGEVIYKDRLDGSVIHRTQFSWEADVNITDVPPQVLAQNPNIAPNVIMSFQPRGVHNCADEECQADK